MRIRGTWLVAVTRAASCYQLMQLLAMAGPATNLPAYGSNLNRNILDFMRWPQIDLGAQDLNGIQRPKSFQTNSWK
jgi:hypothetical protein